MSRRWNRGQIVFFLFTSVAFASVSAPVIQAAAAMQIPRADSLPEEVLIEIQLGRIATRTIRAFRARDEVLIPASVFLDLAEIRHQRLADGSLEATVQPEGRRLLVPRGTDTLSYGEQQLAFGTDAKLFHEGEYFLASGPLGDLLGLRFTVDWQELAVVVADPSSLPIARRVRRESAREAYLHRSSASSSALLLEQERRRWDGFIIDYSVLTPSSDIIGGGAYSLGVGADALGGSFQAGLTSLDRGSTRLTRLEGSWTGVWRDRPWLRQLRLGDDISTGPQVRSLRGISVTNTPYVRPPQLGTANYMGHLPPGWEVEAYRGGTLIAFDSVGETGRYALDLPVQYGENPIDFVAYGPYGEVREFNRTYRAITELLPERQFEYGASVGSCRSGTCDATANLDLRYGINSRWTVQGGIEQFWRDSLADLSHLYFIGAGSINNAWALQAGAAAGAFAQGGVRYEPSINLRVSADYVRYAPTKNPLLVPAGRTEQWSLRGFFRPDPEAGFFFFEGSVDRIATVSGTTDAARLGASLQVREIRLLPYARLQHESHNAAAATTRPYLGINAFVLPRPALGKLLGQVWVRTALEVEAASRPTLASISAARPLGPGARIEAGVSWLHGSPGPTFNFILSSYLSMLRSTTMIAAPPHDGWNAVQSVQGSVLWNEAARRLAFAPGPSLERSGIAGRVFLDLNANGRLDPAEPGAPGVRVRVGTTATLSDAAGRYRVWDIVPFEPIAVSIDTLSLTSPLWTPGFPDVSVVPGPNRFQTLDIPIALGAVIEGKVSRETAGGRVGLGGVTLILTNRATGERRAITTFSDGDFYAIGIKPGSYEIAVAARVLMTLKATSEPRRFTVAPDPNGATVSGVELLVESSER